MSNYQKLMNIKTNYKSYEKIEIITVRN